MKPIPETATPLDSPFPIFLIVQNQVNDLGHKNVSTFHQEFFRDITQSSTVHLYVSPSVLQ